MEALENRITFKRLSSDLLSGIVRSPLDIRRTAPAVSPALQTRTP